MAAPCDQLERFADGELAPAEAEAFRDHLLQCARCQAELEHLLQIDHRVAFRAAAAPPARVSHSPVLWARRPWAMAVFAATAAAAAVLFFVLPRRGPSADPWLLAEAERRVDLRLAYAPADRHRPLAARSMGPGGAAEKRLPLEALAELERSGDGAGLAAAFLLRGDRNLAEQALAALAPLESSPEIETDRAAAFLALGDPAEALRHLELAVDAAPRLGPALWNRALAFQALDLRRSAARAFEKVAELGESGWADEARKRAAELSAAERARQERWQAAGSAGESLVSSGALPSPEILADQPPVLRLYFYDAVRTRTSRGEVEALLPLARELDRQVGGDALAKYVSRAAGSDFVRRAPLARGYAQLRQGTLPRDDTERLIAELLRSKEDDLALGALVQAGAAGAHLDAFTTRAEASGDPWFRLLARHERAKALIARGESREAKQVLEEAMQRCAEVPVSYRCVRLELELAFVGTQLSTLDDAWTHAERALRQLRATNDLGAEDVGLGHLAQISRLRNDLPLARAYLEELLELGRGKPERERFQRQNLAHLALDALRFDRARAEIDQALATGLPLTAVGAMALSDIARQRPSPRDAEALTQALEAARATASPGQRLLLEHALGRHAVERDPSRGRARLEEVIRQAEAGGLSERDEDARRARTYSYTSLILDEGKAGRYEAALELFGRELGGRLPERCVVAVTEDTERTLLVARGASGQWVGDFQGNRTRRLPDVLSGFAGEAVLKALQGCERVEVFARPPLQGRARLLPPELAWSYRLRTTEPPRPPGGRSIHLVVKDVELAPERARALGRLNAWSAGFGEGEERRVVQGAEATPSRVLASMRDATEIDLVAHGVAGASSEASYLVLAREGERDELSASRIREQRLDGAPLVVLAACRGARAARVLHEPTSLPAAFLRAGARGVIAATVEIPDLEAAAFFNAVRARIRAGTAPTVALRDERLKWRSEKKGRIWLDHVLTYE